MNRNPFQPPMGDMGVDKRSSPYPVKANATKHGVLSYEVGKGLTAGQRIFEPTRGLRYWGFAIVENGTTPTNAAAAIIRHGANAQGQLLMPIQLLPGESRSEWLPPGIDAEQGLYLDVTLGTVWFTVFYSLEGDGQ